MSPDPSALTVLHGSVRGIGKKFSQDSYAVTPVAGGAALVLAVADGHGSGKHFRSHLGSRWAVGEFTDCVTPFARHVAEREHDERAWHALFAQARDPAGPICHRWREQVMLYEAANPARGVTGDGRPPDPARLDPVPYGTTLIGLLVTRRLLFGWQVGDGDVTVSARADRTLEQPLAGEEQYGDDTDSLCLPEPWTRMRVHTRPLEPVGHRVLVIANTDGLSKSFAESDGYLRFASGMHEALDREGARHVQGQLEDWLTRAAGFSGDDTTLVGVYIAG